LTIINYAKVFEDLADDISENAINKGFWDIPGVGDGGIIPLKLALVASEVSEALETHRKFYDDDVASEYTGMTQMQEDDFEEELADIIIRVLDIIGFYGFDDFGDVVLAKMDKNRERPPRHGKRY
jgi:NTP pyrophosphatase (non-canonical NTP hydrolase)